MRGNSVGIVINGYAINAKYKGKSMLLKENIIKAEDYILRIYKNSNIIGLGEGAHGLENSHTFFRNMFDNKKIREMIDIVIVEFANIDYQPILDRYIAGESIEFAELCKVWRETTQSHCLTWDKPVYFQLLKKIRDTNTILPVGKKIKVLAGDPAINWKLINTKEDYFNYLSDRRKLPAELAIHNGIAKNQKVLLIYAGSHFPKINHAPHLSSITMLVNENHPGAMKVIEVFNTKEFEIEEKIKNWPLYSIIDLEKNAMGHLPAEKLFSSVLDKNGNKIKCYNEYKLKDIFDACLYVGPFESWKISEAPKSVFAEQVYCNELKRRYEIVWGKS